MAEARSYRSLVAPGPFDRGRCRIRIDQCAWVNWIVPSPNNSLLACQLALRNQLSEGRDVNYAHHASEHRFEEGSLQKIFYSDAKVLHPFDSSPIFSQHAINGKSGTTDRILGGTNHRHSQRKDALFIATDNRRRF